MLAAKHARYFQRCLAMFPTQVEEYDSSHVSLVFFSILGLRLLGQTPIGTPEEWAQWVQRRQVKSTGGFRGSTMHCIDEPSRYDPEVLSATFFSLAILAMTEEAGKESGTSESSDTRKAWPDKQAILEFVRACQLPSGEFLPMPGIAAGVEPSVRHSYTALAILELLGIDDSEIKTKAARYLQSCQTAEGGFGENSGSEAHVGLTFCCLAALKLCGRLDLIDTERVVDFLAHRQCLNGGFNGRVNKQADTCYSFWAGASLAILGYQELVDAAAARRFLLDECQDDLLGGFVKVKGSRADPLHSCLGLCALSLFGEPLLELDPLLCLPMEVRQRLRQGRQQGRQQ